MKLSFAGKTDIGLIRSNNEDYLAIKQLSPEEYVFVVADGMGGHLAGEVASKLAVDSFISALENNLSAEKDPKEFFEKLMEEINDKILSIAEKDPSKRGMGTTLSALYIKGEQAYIVHVGDSRIYLFRNGKLSRLTEDHSVVERMVKSGLLSPQQAMMHPKRNVLYQSLGMRSGVRPQIMGPIEIKKGDRFLLCTDGLSALVTEEEKAMFLKDYDPDEAVSKLISLARQRGAPDNVTVIVAGKDIPPKEHVEKTAVLKTIPFSWKRLGVAASIIVLIAGFILFITDQIKKETAGSNIKKVPGISWLVWKPFAEMVKKWSVCREGLLIQRENGWVMKRLDGKEERLKFIPEGARLVPSPVLAWLKKGELRWVSSFKPLKIYRKRVKTKSEIVYFVPPSRIVYEKEGKFEVVGKKLIQLPKLKYNFFYDEKGLLYSPGFLNEYNFVSQKLVPYSIDFRGEKLIFLHRSATGEFVFWTPRRAYKGGKQFRYKDTQGRELKLRKIMVFPDKFDFFSEGEKGRIYVKEGEL